MSDDQQHNDSPQPEDNQPDTKPTREEYKRQPLPTTASKAKGTHKFSEPIPNQDDVVEETTALHISSPRQDTRQLDPMRETAVIPRDNPGLRRALNNQSVSKDGATKIGERREVILLIRGMVERVNVVENSSFILGRFEMGAVKDEEVDLTPYGALDRGVSRLHAQIHLEDDQLYITDLGSTNGTYLGGNRLTPNEATMLRKGDELLLGRLAIQILFR